MARGEVECTIGQLESNGSEVFLSEHADEFIANSVWCSVQGCKSSARFNQNGTIESHGFCKKDGINHGGRTIGPKCKSSPEVSEETSESAERTEAAQAISDKEQDESRFSERAKSRFERIAWGMGIGIIAFTVRVRQ